MRAIYLTESTLGSSTVVSTGPLAEFGAELPARGLGSLYLFAFFDGFLYRVWRSLAGGGMSSESWGLKRRAGGTSRRGTIRLSCLEALEAAYSLGPPAIKMTLVRDVSSLNGPALAECS